MSGKRKSLVCPKAAADKTKNTATIVAVRKRRKRALLFNKGNPPQGCNSIIGFNIWKIVRQHDANYFYA
jgi:hypothetical protein